jgi:hypothetical protein
MSSWQSTAILFSKFGGIALLGKKPEPFVNDAQNSMTVAGKLSISMK